MSRERPPLYKPHRYVPPQRIWCYHCFGLKMGFDFAHFALEHVGFSRKLQECMNPNAYFNIVSIPNEKTEK